MIKFYEIEYINKTGQSLIENVVGDYEQVNEYAIKEASVNGFAYNVRLLATEKFNDVKNITNY